MPSCVEKFGNDLRCIKSVECSGISDQCHAHSFEKMVMAACAGTFLFILGFFLILELLDRTLRDSIRTRRLIGLPMLGAFPKDSILEYHNHVEESKSIATKQLSNSILRFCQQKKEGLPYIINFISTEGGEGKSYVIEALKNIGTVSDLKQK